MREVTDRAACILAQANAADPGGETPRGIDVVVDAQITARADVGDGAGARMEIRHRVQERSFMPPTPSNTVATRGDGVLR